MGNDLFFNWGLEQTPDIDSILGCIDLPCLGIRGAIVPLFLYCALSMWWNGLTLSWGFKKCISAAG